MDVVSLVMGKRATFSNCTHSHPYLSVLLVYLMPHHNYWAAKYGAGQKDNCHGMVQSSNTDKHDN